MLDRDHYQEWSLFQLLLMIHSFVRTLSQLLSHGPNSRVHGQEKCSWKEEHDFATSRYIHQENYWDMDVGIKMYKRDIWSVMEKHRTTTIQSLDDTLRDLLPWDIELVIDVP